MKSNRRDFLRKSSLGILAASLIPFKLKGESKSDCEPTTTDILGPFFSEGAPQTNTIVPEGYEGERLFLTGKLTATDCENNIADAVLDFWQANENGAYDNDGYNFRGKIITDAEGNYSLETIVPGKYLNGSQYRPAHIHLKVQAEGYDELVTQIYFQGDTDIPADPLASSPAAAGRIINLSPGFAGDWFGSFDIVLSGNGPVGINELQCEFGDLSQNFPNPFSTSTRLFLVLNKDAFTQIEIFDSKGSAIHMLMNQQISAGRYELNWETEKQANGTYTLVWYANNKLVKTIKMIKQST